jgi:hypothetical protein
MKSIYKFEVYLSEVIIQLPSNELSYNRSDEINRVVTLINVNHY